LFWNELKIPTVQHLQETFTFGVIEGFFGKTWSWADRSIWAKFLSKIGGNLYIYAPKKDPFFRRLWREPIDPQHFAQLTNCRSAYRTADIGFGVGITPFDVQNGLSLADRDALKAKINQLNKLELDYLAILFDDMRGDFPGLADSQLEIIDRITNISNAKKFAICPTYYSDDPVLEQVFGNRPPDYWEKIRSLDRSINIFWTGEKVCSNQYSSEHLGSVRDRFDRPVLLWDNYPANDGKRLTTRLHFNNIGQRDASIQDGCVGQLMNPMNQPFLSRITVATMARVLKSGIKNPPLNCHLEIKNLAVPDLAALMIRDSQQFALEGLEGMSESDRKSLGQQYSQFNEPMAIEIVDWLNGEYAFDPSCLTD
jgi:hyaluronoglucosaminidase